MADEVTLKLDFENLPSAEDIGDVFSALARDYREMTMGRTLVVVRVRSGSIVASLTDAALAAVPYIEGGLAVVVAINALAQFAENLKTWFGYAKSSTEKNRLYRKGRKSPGQRSVEAIVKVAANTRSHVRVNYKSDKGEILEVELTPVQAISASEQLHADDIEKAGGKPAKGGLRSAPEVQAAIERLQQIGARKLSATQVNAIVDVIIAVLEAAGAGHLLPEIASEFRLRGLHNIAYAVRRHIHPSGGTHKPPLTTT